MPPGGSIINVSGVMALTTAKMPARDNRTDARAGVTVSR